MLKAKNFEVFGIQFVVFWIRNGRRSSNAEKFHLDSTKGSLIFFYSLIIFDSHRLAYYRVMQTCDEFLRLLDAFFSSFEAVAMLFIFFLSKPNFKAIYVPSSRRNSFNFFFPFFLLLEHEFSISYLILFWLLTFCSMENIAKCTLKYVSSSDSLCLSR